MSRERSAATEVRYLRTTLRHAVAALKLFMEVYKPPECGKVSGMARCAIRLAKEELRPKRRKVKP